MKRPYFVIGSAAVCVAFAVVVVRFFPEYFGLRFLSTTVVVPATAPATITVHGGGAPVDITIDTAVTTEVVEEEQGVNSLETVTVEPIPYFPPPSVNLTGGTLGRQVVPGTDELGDVSQLYFSKKDQALYVTLVEVSGLRSVWRLDQYGAFKRVFADDIRPGEIRILGDGTGTMYVMLNDPDRIYRTDDNFGSWHLVMKDRGIFWNVAADGKGNVYGALHSYNEPILYRSQDEGKTWEPWIDFRKVLPADAVTYAEGDDRNKLRHLHDVIYNDKTDAIIVGTGDVARYTLRSDDNGVSWKKIWDEGFTAHAEVSGGNRYLLCPDKLRGPGIALYDAWKLTLKETFSPGDSGFAGYCYSIINVDGIYYASFHTEKNEVADLVPKSGIVVSPDAINWYSFLEWDPLTNAARTDIWLASAPARVYASINGRLYAFSPLNKAWFTDKTPLK